MLVKFDYFTGSVMGHKTRCEAFMDALSKRGHQVVTDGKYDWLVVDYPDGEYPKVNFPEWDEKSRRLLMGTLPKNHCDFAWHALHAPYPRTLTGKEYLILDRKLETVDKYKRNSFLISCGGADPYHLTEKILQLAIHNNQFDMEHEYKNGVVIGPNFNRDIEVPKNWQVYYHPSHRQLMETMGSYRTVICAWGNTAFEALYLGCKVYVIPTSVGHIEEIEFLGIDYTLMENLDELPKKLMIKQEQVKLDINGLDRIIDFMERNT